jgi:hypothetical protein
LQTENLKKIIFVNKNWLNDLRIGCKSLSNLITFLERDINLGEELKKIEDDFEKDVEI